MCVCMITGMVFLYVNVCLYLNVNFVILYVVVQRAKRKTAVAILVPQFSYFNFHMNFSCKLSVYIYICFLCMKIENKFYSREVSRKKKKRAYPGLDIYSQKFCYHSINPKLCDCPGHRVAHTIIHSGASQYAF